MSFIFSRTSSYVACRKGGGTLRTPLLFSALRRFVYLANARDERRHYAATLPRPAYESSFWTSKEVYETFHNRRKQSPAISSGVTNGRDGGRGEQLPRAKQARGCRIAPPKLFCHSLLKSERDKVGK